MKISIFGMGYVGVVSGACLLRDGHEVIGVDPVASKVTDLSQGHSPIQEPGVTELLTEGYEAGRFKATTEPSKGLAGSDMVWICVGTPSEPNGDIDFSAVDTVIGQIGRSLRNSQDRPLVVLRSTCLPGTTSNRVIPLLEEASGLKVSKDIRVVYHPEFLREGTAVKDFENPPKIIVGEAYHGAGDLLFNLYEKYEAPHFRMEPAEAEMVKYCDNLFHALKVTFANEIASLVRTLGVDARRISEVFCADTKLNISPAYLRPGPAYGGSCLPKDLRAILRLASLNSLHLPMLQGIPESNDIQIHNLILRVLAYRPNSVGIIGLAFKCNTDDMRGSPYVKVAKSLIGEGIRLRIYDPAVEPDRLIGSNKEQVQKALGHLVDLLVPSLEDLSSTDLILVNHPIVDSDRIYNWLNAGIRILDLVDIKSVDRIADLYEGIYW
ncbi:MAG: nucleotide sugar dehydrogenase [Phycisphaerae bacterium]|nr:UDP-glucose/GDP-mannose dehydrogenase family protein [Phycisphaerae bacterium]NIP54679.1 UDP-glucose/GDP-mannose dehydrogenase family protein [Phycisphaerae bacterium]NIU11008.1 UDP-glucose/GDP-mannose dehydrogenase family protein [Phycisphaerae bacterium]NIU58891.1 nucleotide sugar dehydrogenase [Phycisphaerae bacterium]NIV70333.1 nucleotide sugar dehydrogenase [Phycisphaerae bacterium]